VFYSQLGACGICTVERFSHHNSFADGVKSFKSQLRPQFHASGIMDSSVRSTAYRTGCQAGPVLAEWYGKEDEVEAQERGFRGEVGAGARRR